MTIFECTGSNNTAREDLSVVPILVLVALANLQLANQVLAGFTEPVSLERRYPVAGGQIFVHRILELKIKERHDAAS